MSGTTNPNRRGGIATLSIDGVAYDVASNATYFANRFKRETNIGQSGVQGFNIRPEAGYISAEIRDNGSLSVAYLNSLENATVVLTLANGKMVYGDAMWNTEAEEVKTQEATFMIKFEGDEVFEQTV